MQSFIEEVVHATSWLLAIKDLALDEELGVAVIVIYGRLAALVSAIELGVYSDVIVDPFGKLELLFRIRFISFDVEDPISRAVLYITFCLCFSAILVLYFDLLTFFCLRAILLW